MGFRPDPTGSDRTRPDPTGSDPTFFNGFMGFLISFANYYISHFPLFLFLEDSPCAWGPVVLFQLIASILFLVKHSASGNVGEAIGDG